MRYLITIPLLASMLAANFSSCFVMMNYAFNKKDIAARFCENRNRPEMKCEGKCWLCKKLDKENKNSRSTDLRSFKFEVLSVWQTGPVLPSPFPPEIPNWPIHDDKGCVSCTRSFFHPPQG